MKNKVFLTVLLALTLFAVCASAAPVTPRPFAKIADRITSGIAVSGNNLFLGDSIGRLYALNASTGATVWTTEGPTASTVVGLPAVQGDTVVFAQADGSLTCVKASDGSTLWTYTLPGNETGGLNDGVALGGGMVYAAYNSGKLCAFDLKNGRVAWTYESEQGLRTAPVYANGLVLLGEYNGLFSMLDAKTGKRVNGGGAGGAINSPVVNAGNVYYSAWDGSVHSVQIKDVIPLWDANVREPITTAPVIADGVIIVATAMGKVVALNEADGALLWQYETRGGEIPAAPVIAGGRVIAGTGDNRVLVLDAKTGRLHREFSTGSALSTNGGKFYFTKDAGELYSME